MCRLLPFRAWLGHTDCKLLGDTLHRSTQACFSHGKHGHLGGLLHSPGQGGYPSRQDVTVPLWYVLGMVLLAFYRAEVGRNHHCKVEMHRSHTSPGTFRGWHRTGGIFWQDIFDKSILACAWHGICHSGAVFPSPHPSQLGYAQAKHQAPSVAAALTGWEHWGQVFGARSFLLLQVRHTPALVAAE